MVPLGAAIAFLPVEQGGLGVVHEVGDARSNASYERNKYPALRGVEKGKDPPSEIFPAPYPF